MTTHPATPATERFLITGAFGCIGAWTVRQLINEGTYVAALDASDDPRRLRLLLEESELATVQLVRADITDLSAIEAALARYGITNVIHLAALQVPFCRANPPLGAQVNVVGMVNVLEAMTRRAAAMAPLVYASSIAAYEALEHTDGDREPATDGGTPGTLYGVYKRANEGSATIYARDRGLASIGLRPHTVYGVGRDQGVTSSPTAAMLAAAKGEPYTISYGGRFQLQHAADVARTFIAASRTMTDTASVHNLSGTAVHMTDVIAAIEAITPAAAGMIGFEDVKLGFPTTVDSASLEAILPDLVEMPLSDGVAETITRFRTLLAGGLLPSR